MRPPIRTVAPEGTEPAGGSEPQATAARPMPPTATARQRTRPPNRVEQRFGTVPVADEVDRLPAGGGPGRVAAAEPDASHVEVVRAEAVVERETGEEAEEQRPRCVDHHRADGEWIGPTPGDVVNDERAQDRADAAGRRDGQRQDERGGVAGSHRRPTTLRRSVLRQAVGPVRCRRPPAPARRPAVATRESTPAAACPSLASTTASTASVEYVVQPPSRPTMRNGRRSEAPSQARPSSYPQAGPAGRWPASRSG